MKHIYLVFALVLYGCSGATAPEAPVGYIIPLVVGNTWIGEATEYASGTIRRSVLDTIRVESDTIVDGELRYLFNRQNGFVNRSDGAYTWGFGQGGEPTLILKYPARQGDSVVYGDSSAMSITIHVISTNESVTVPAGTFTCYHYYATATFGQFDSHHYFAPNVGFVRTANIAKAGVQGVADSALWVLKEVVLK